MRCCIDLLVKGFGDIGSVLLAVLTPQPPHSMLPLHIAMAMSNNPLFSDIDANVVELGCRFALTVCTQVQVKPGVQCITRYVPDACISGRYRKNGVKWGLG